MSVDVAPGRVTGLVGMNGSGTSTLFKVIMGLATPAAGHVRVELTELADRQIGQLSGGQRKRAFVACGLAQGARILLLDEPFAGVD